MKLAFSQSKMAMALVGSFANCFLFVGAQNVGIGTNMPLANLHVRGEGFNPSIVRLDNDGSLQIYNGGATSYTSLGNVGTSTLLQNNGSFGRIVLRPGSTGPRDVVINGTGLAIAPREALGGVEPIVPLELRANAEVMRISGTTPYLTMMDGGFTRGYIQAWTDGIALASNGFDVGLWTNGQKRLAIKPSGAFEVGGSAGAAGQVLTSLGAGVAPVWASPGNGLYNSFRFISMPGFSFKSISNSVWRDIPGLTYTFTISGNHYVDVAAAFQANSEICFGCDRPNIGLRLLVNGNSFTGMGDEIDGSGANKALSLTTGFTLPPGTHTLQWQVFSNDGSDVILRNNSLNIPNETYMRVWMVPQ